MYNTGGVAVLLRQMWLKETPEHLQGKKKKKTAYEIRTSDYTNHDLHFIENIITSTLPLQLIDNNII